jgi:dTDP-4-dehydrorhamnose reductase
LKAARKIQAISDVWASATYVCDLAARVTEIISHGHYATYHVVNDDLCSQLDFALEAARILEISDPGELIESVNLSDLQRPAKRPRYTPLSCLSSKDIGLPVLRSWRVALADYINRGSTT